MFLMLLNPLTVMLSIIVGMIRTLECDDFGGLIGMLRTRSEYPTRQLPFFTVAASQSVRAETDYNSIATRVRFGPSLNLTLLYSGPWSPQTEPLQRRMRRDRVRPGGPISSKIPLRI